MPITYRIEIDLDRDGLFGNAYADITDRIIDVSWSLGMPNSFEQVSRSILLNATLHDPDLAFSQESNTPPFGDIKRDTMIRLIADVNGQSFTLVTVWIKSIDTIDSAYATVARIVAEDKLWQLQDAEYLPMLDTHVRVDEEIQNVLNSAVVAYPYTGYFWVLGASRLSVDTRLFIEQMTTLEQSVTTLEWVGDFADRGHGVSALGYIMDLMRPENGGRFFVDRTGKFVFHNRHHDILQEEIPGTEGLAIDTFNEAEYEREFQVVANEVYNVVTVNYYPRAIGAPDSILWTSDRLPITISGDSETKIVARYRDPDNEDAVVGGTDVIAPVRGVDFIANTAEDGGGDDASALISVSAEIGGSATEIRIANPTADPLYITTLRIRGTPLTIYNRETVEIADAPSIQQHDRIPFPIVDVRFASTEERGNAIARQLLGRYRQPITRYEFIRFRVSSEDGSRDNLAQRVLERSVGQVVRITNAITNHNRYYVIQGEQHSIQGRVHLVTWILRPTSRSPVWRLGISQLNINTGLG